MPLRKPIHFTDHARQAMLERDLDLAWVEMTVREPEWRTADPGDPAVDRRFRSIPERDGRILRAVCVETNREIRVLSAFLDRRARRPQ